MKQIKYAVLLAALTTLPGCAPFCCQEKVATQLQVREVQTRMFEECDMKTVMKAMINVLQDDGYIVKNAVLDLGLLSAEKNIDVESPKEVFLATLLCREQPRWSKHAVMEVSANVSDFGSDAKVRVNFQRKTFDNYGCVKDVEQVMDNYHYKAFFAKVSKGIFLQSENL